MCGALDVARQDVRDAPRSRSAAYSGLIAAPGTPKACVTPSFSITSTAAIAAFIFAIVGLLGFLRMGESSPHRGPGRVQPGIALIPWRSYG
jgi:hypothetical protein